MGMIVNGALDVCPDCGQNQSFLFDAYGIGDRLMEGVIFEYSFDGIDFAVKPTPVAEKYLACGFDKNYWVEEVKEYLESHNGYDSVKCSKCFAWYA